MAKRKKFTPQKTTQTPPALCWEVVLAHSPTVLSKWRWIWMLRQVCRAFRDLIQPDLWVRWQCASDLKPMIWKKKADEVLALTARDLADVEFTVKDVTRYKEVHLMSRKTALEIALAKHGGTFSGINDVFLRRRARKKAARRFY